MSKDNVGLVADVKCSARCWIVAVGLMVPVIFLLVGTASARTRWTPSVFLAGIYDDNVLYERTNAQDDYIYLIRPELKLDYDQELTRIASSGSVAFRRYQDNDDLNDEIYNFDFNGSTSLTERLHMRGRYRFIKDTTFDSELKETGRIFQREDRISNAFGLNTNVDMTERLNIGVNGNYRDVAYDSESLVDYTTWRVNLDVRWNLATQIDTLYFTPGYSDRDSDVNHSKTYDLILGWAHQTTERLNMDISGGARHTELEQFSTGETDKNWNWVSKLKLAYTFQTALLNVDFERNLENTANGRQADVNKVIARLRWDFSERVGTELNGSYYYTKTEGKNVDETTEYIQGGAELYYKLTEDHAIFVAYDYSQDNLKDATSTPRAERNQLWAGVRLNFPIE